MHVMEGKSPGKKERWKSWTGNHNIALLFIFITAVFINQIVCDDAQACHQHDYADREHVWLIFCALVHRLGLGKLVCGQGF